VNSTHSWSSSFFSVCRLLLEMGVFKYEAAFFSLISFSIFTAVD
jgi:hypothetical protein